MRSIARSARRSNPIHRVGDCLAKNVRNDECILTESEVGVNRDTGTQVDTDLPVYLCTFLLCTCLGVESLGLI